MVFEWPRTIPLWITPKLVLDNWRERIDQIETQETDYLASLPYVRGVAVIGSVGRGNPWPVSDIDLLIVADCWKGQDPEVLIRSEENKRNRLLEKKSIINNIEAGNWVILAHDTSTAVSEDEDAFLKRLEHPHWRGIVIKSQDARVRRDFDSQIYRFINRCNGILFTDRFVYSWLQEAIGFCENKLKSAAKLITQGDYPNASLEILRTTFQMFPSGAYAKWRRLPQSLARGVTQFLSTASEVGTLEVQELYLTAARLNEDDTWQRFAAAPPEGKQQRDTLLAIRRGADEHIDELGATRDLLNLSLLETVVWDESPGPRPEWTGVTADRLTVQTQFEAAQEMLSYLLRGLQ